MEECLRKQEVFFFCTIKQYNNFMDDSISTTKATPKNLALQFFECTHV